MAALTALLLLLCAAKPARWHDRYFGGSVTFSPKGRGSDGTFEVEIRDRQTTSYCSHISYTCYNGDCGSEIQNASAYTGNSYYWDYWCQYETVTRRKLISNLPFEISYPSYSKTTDSLRFWIKNVRGPWTFFQMMAHIDLGIRSDTGESNRPPVTCILPFLTVPRNCPRTFNLTVFDPDGDQVRCRAATDSSTSECGQCGLHPGFSLDQDSCTLKYTPDRSTGYHPIELMVEDFPNSDITLSYSDGSHASRGPFSHQLPYSSTVLPATSTEESSTVMTTALFKAPIAPISKLPLEFYIYVDSYGAPSCTEGDYFPIFLTPTPSNGATLPAFVNHPLEIKVRTSAQYTRIYDLIATGPVGISQKKISTEEFIVRWTPTGKEADDHFSICFVSLAYDNSSNLYQSELRCVIAEVGYDSGWEWGRSASSDANCVWDSADPSWDPETSSK